MAKGIIQASNIAQPLKQAVSGALVLNFVRVQEDGDGRDFILAVSATIVNMIRPGAWPRHFIVNGGEILRLCLTILQPRSLVRDRVRLDIVTDPI